MTVCIAVACQFRNRPRIVTCTDWKVTTSYGSADISDKLRWIKKPNWIALTSGTKKYSETLVRACRQAVSGVNLTDDSLLPILTRVAQEQLAGLKNEYVFATLGISYEAFRLHWKRQFPESVALQTFTEIRSIRLGASLIIAGFVPKGKGTKPIICKIDQTGDVTVSDHFACSGDGSRIANPFLLWREYTSSVSMMEATYRIYEAKKMSEILNSVGESTSVDILYPDGELEQFSDKGHDKLESMFRKFGPKKKIAFTKLEKRWFDSLEFNSLH